MGLGFDSMHWDRNPVYMCVCVGSEVQANDHFIKSSQQ